MGYKRLQTAIRQYQTTNPTAAFTITWHPYYLNPAAPDPSIDKLENYAARFGAAQSANMHARLAAAGTAEGINFSFKGRTGRTRDSHRLIELGRTKGLQTPVVEKLFRAYFEDERDITQIDVLVKVAGEAGLDEEEARVWFQGEGGGEAVDREVLQAKLKGVSGVPNFTVNGAHKLSGAQDPEEFVSVFEFFAED